MTSWFDPKRLKVTREKRCLAFCSVFRNKDIELPSNCLKLVCEFAFAASHKEYVANQLRKFSAEQEENYSRHAGKLVLRQHAKHGERVRTSPYYRSGSPGRGVTL
mmetsp:Transcript_25999/g.39359  ORF Transcript_25999/g.39359 Transcript_25999/m.39359 type:complete len:105 (-) Transcript_25999:609-923(-)